MFGDPNKRIELPSSWNRGRASRTDSYSEQPGRFNTKHMFKLLLPRLVLTTNDTGAFVPITCCIDFSLQLLRPLCLLFFFKKQELLYLLVRLRLQRCIGDTLTCFHEGSDELLATREELVDEFLEVSFVAL